jgi:hypothetical protein
MSVRIKFDFKKMSQDRVEVNGVVVSLEVNSRAGIIHGL